MAQPGVERVSHIGICVRDPARAERFYTRALGFEAVSELDVSGRAVDTLLRLEQVALHALYLERDGLRIELLHFEAPGTTPEAPRAMNTPGFTHLSMRVSDLDAVAAAVESAGGRILADTRIGDPKGSHAVLFVTDPDGTPIELVRAPGDPAILPGRPPASGRVS